MPKPQMVREWSTSADGLVWSFTLQPGLKFYAGQRVTAADVIPSLQRWNQRDVVGQKLGAAVTGMDALDADTFEIKVSKPYPAMLFSLGSGIGRVPVILRAKDLVGDPTKTITTAIGSAPFLLNADNTTRPAALDALRPYLATGATLHRHGSVSAPGGAAQWCGWLLGSACHRLSEYR